MGNLCAAPSQQSPEARLKNIQQLREGMNKYYDKRINGAGRDISDEERLRRIARSITVATGCIN